MKRVERATVDPDGDPGRGEPAVQEAPAGAAAAIAPGVNCWRVEHATRFRCVQDGAEYFRLVREALLQARDTAFILGWDIAAGVDLLPGATGEREPTRLGELLDFIVRRRRGLRVYVLIWDYSAVYALERDPFSRLRLGWGTPARVRFRYDAQHPLTASHHQKIIVVDDRVAFSGGLDLTWHRWDTAEHAPEHPLRKNMLGAAYAPFHDVQALVEGPVAASLGELCRERWRRSGGRRLAPLAPAADERWPRSAEPDLTDVAVAIARTEPRFAGRLQVRECEALFLDSIAAARSTIYLENQYFTNLRMAKALGARLAEEHGPEVIVVCPKECEGWLERRTMGRLRNEVIAHLARSDRHGRLRLLHPVASRERHVETFIHSKVTVIDDELLRIGSANLSNRSMGVDTECDVCAVAHDEARRAGIRRVRDRLVAEHVGLVPDEVAAAVAREGSLRAALDRLGGGDRALCPIERVEGLSSETSAVLTAADPDEPMRVSQALDRLLPEIGASDRRRSFVVWILPLCAFAVTWVFATRSTELERWLGELGPRRVITLAPAPDAVAAVFGVFVLGGLLFVPLELLVLGTVVIFGAARGGALALAGAAASATLGYALGRLLRPAHLVPVIGPRAYRLWRELRQRGAVSVAVLRLVSIASATTIHLLCGAARVRFRDYALGSLIGLAPGFLALCLLGALLRALVLRPGPVLALVTAGVALALAGLVLRVRHTFLVRQLRPSIAEQEERARFG